MTKLIIMDGDKTLLTIDDEGSRGQIDAFTNYYKYDIEELALRLIKLYGISVEALPKNLVRFRRSNITPTTTAE